MPHSGTKDRFGMQYGTAIIAGSYGTVADALGEYASAVATSGSVFVLFRTEYGVNGDVAKDFMDVIRVGADCGLTYVNTVVVPVKEPVVSGVPDNVLYIVWFSKDYASCFIFLYVLILFSYFRKTSDIRLNVISNRIFCQNC